MIASSRPRLWAQTGRLVLTLFSFGAAWGVRSGRAANATPPPAQEKLLAEGLALLREWHPAIYPPAELKAKHSGMVTVRLIVNESGHVAGARALEDSDQAFVDSAITAVKSWVFTPAVEQGAVVACCLDTLVAFSPAVGQERKTPGDAPPASQTFSSAPRTPPKPVATPSGGYPEVLVERKLSGTVRFTCVISTEGRAIQSRIVAASHADFVLPALEALNHWEFSPGTWGDLPVVAPVDGRMTFDGIGNKVAEVYAANGLTAPDGTPSLFTPEMVFVADPVWPIERLLAGESGSAAVEFTLNQNGSVKDIKIREATQPEFGQALAAAVECWIFDRPAGNDGVALVELAKHAEFAAIPLDATADSAPLARLVLALRHGEITAAKGLDEKITPIFRVSPAYPVTLLDGERPKGHADIEFVIDRDGRARLPRIIAASLPEFGWSAATAVSQWIFKAPRRAGQPVDVKVKIPFEFTPPEK